MVSALDWVLALAGKCCVPGQDTLLSQCHSPSLFQALDQWLSISGDDRKSGRAMSGIRDEWVRDERDPGPRLLSPPRPANLTLKGNPAMD